MIKLNEAIEKAREKTKEKICRIQENENAYIITFCPEDGIIQVGIYPWRVDKTTGKVTCFHYTNPEFFKPLNEVKIPEEYKDIFIKARIPEE